MYNLISEFNKAIKFLESDDSNQAENILLELYRKSPGNKGIGRALGFAYMQSNKIEELLKHLSELVKATDQDPICILDYAKALRLNRNYDQAIQQLTEVLARVETLTPGWFLLGDILVEHERFEQACKVYRKAELHDPFSIQIEQVKKCLQSSDSTKAKRILTHILEQDPKHIEALSGMAVLAMQAGKNIQAEKYFNEILTRTTYWPTLLLGLSQLFLTTSRAEAASETLRTLLKVNPQSVIAWNMLGAARELLMQHEQAISAYQQSLKINSNQPQVNVSIGNVYRIIGNRYLCEQFYKYALKYAGANGEAYWALSNLKDYIFSEYEFNLMEKEFFAANKSLHQAAPLSFAFAKAVEDRKQYQKAFTLYKHANNLQKIYSTFDVDTYNKEIDSLKCIFDKEFIFRNKRNKIFQVNPIFIVGMPRSGSTLIEQMLSNHSKIDATMELPFIGQYVKEINEKLSSIGEYPESLRYIEPDLFDDMLVRYVKDSKVYTNGALYFIDKMSSNFAHVGLIKILFPSAKIIDMRRHPMDTCLSIFKQRFIQGHSYSYDLNDIACYYIGYCSLMSHWRNIFQEQIQTVYYENLVHRPNHSIRNLLFQIGLDFDSECLYPQNNKRPIRTASSEQVRKGLYKDGISYWRNFNTELKGLKSHLNYYIQEYEEQLQLE
ncbi:tetratricopeptide repeat-containing sulfotransferase family protein [Microbulbifer sp. 2201CG32-9]|uniref:tetratricopeptide repeat-containing sulfotransferase family protein n=1 Tax=Microbulbifer sp. 2201CG32-9 TaxID=3232309 RepID=UPI00345C3A7B